MEFRNMSDKQIIEAISLNMEKKRISKNLTAEDMALKGGHSSQVYSNFINKNTNIKLETLIQMFRGIGELDKLQKAIEFSEQSSLFGSATTLRKRVRPSQTRLGKVLNKRQENNQKKPNWGEDEE